MKTTPFTPSKLSNRAYLYRSLKMKFHSNGTCILCLAVLMLLFGVCRAPAEENMPAAQARDFLKKTKLHDFKDDQSGEEYLIQAREYKLKGELQTIPWHNKGHINYDGPSKWCFRLGAETGNSEAQYEYAMIVYDAPYAGSEEDKEALEWIRKSADQGYAAAQFELGVAYLEGKAVPKNDEEAFKWFEKAGLQGHAPAQRKLGICYAKGEGVTLDNIKAYMWFNLAVAGGNTDSTERRIQMTERMTPEEIKEAQLLSSKWKAKTE